MEFLAPYIPYLFNPYTGTILFVIALGYIVRAIPLVANKWIPLIGIVMGSIVFTIIAPLTIATPIVHKFNWYVGMWAAGVVLSAFAWLIHNLALSKLEDWLRDRFPAVDEWFKKTSDDNRNKPQPPPDLS